MMSFQEYAKKLRSEVNPLRAGMPKMSERSPLYDQEAFYSRKPAVGSAETAIDGHKVPKIDSNDVIGSLSGILGPTPEERAAEEQKLQEHRRKMHGWTALFNGLRHLGNLYYATKGAPGQKYSDPHQQIEQQYQEERKRLADIHAADRNYYGTLYNIRRQMEADRRTGEEHQAKLDWYRNRDEMARQKAELDKLKAVRVIKQKDGSLMKFDPVSGEAEPLTEADPLYQEYVRSQINKNNRTGTGGSRSTGNSTSETVEWTDYQGRKHRKTTKDGGSSSGVRNGNDSKIDTGVNWK